MKFQSTARTATIQRCIGVLERAPSALAAAAVIPFLLPVTSVAEFGRL
jgi:hypothetical protein